MRKNNMRSTEEKEKIILEMINSNVGFHTIGKKYELSKSVISRWFYNYKACGIEELKSKTGKNTKRKSKNLDTEMECLKEELLKKEIELMRLKKGYMMRGVGVKKEYVSISELNIK